MASADNPILRDLREEAAHPNTPPLSWCSTRFLHELKYWDATPEQKAEARAVIGRLADPLNPDEKE